MDRAFAELAQLGVGGIQLTPGNMPTAGFADRVARSGLATRTHHGFSYDAFRTREVWAADGTCNVTSTSVHPPRAGAFVTGGVLETMYPGWELGDGDALEAAMARGQWLAVDISHLHIQRTQRLLGDATLARILDYDRIAEVHVSANDGRRDLHAPLAPTTFGLDWARAKLADTPVILECYFHHLSINQRRAQIELVHEGARSCARPTTCPPSMSAG